MPEHHEQKVTVEKNSSVGTVTQIVRFGIPTVLIVAIIAIAITLVSGYNLRNIIEAMQSTEKSSVRVEGSGEAINGPIIQDPLESSPYREGYIELISAIPSLQFMLGAGEDHAYAYSVKYFIPAFDWKKLGYEPHIRIEKIIGFTEYGTRRSTTINDVTAIIGQEASVELTGRFVVPDDRDIFDLEISINFVKIGTSRGTSSDNQIIPISYSITKSSSNDEFDEQLTLWDFVISNEDLEAGCEVFSYAKNSYCNVNGNPVISSKYDIIQCFLDSEDAPKPAMAKTPVSVLFGFYFQPGEGDSSTWVAETATLWGYEFSDSLSAKETVSQWSQDLENEQDPYYIIQRGDIVLYLQDRPSSSKSTICFEQIRSMITRDK